MTEIQNEIRQAFEATERIIVYGDSVDFLAVTRSHLRKAYQLAKKEEEDDGGQTDK